jgi:hypothetical protein
MRNIRGGKKIEAGIARPLGWHDADVAFEYIELRRSAEGGTNADKK